MSLDDHDELRANLAAFALGALDAEEAAALRAHLQVCETCPAELAEYERVSMGLLSAVPARAPSPAVVQRLAARLPSARPASTSRRPVRVSLAQALTFTALAALLVVSMISFGQIKELRNQQAELTRSQQLSQSALAMLVSSSSDSLRIEDAPVNGTLVVDWDTNSGMLILSNVAALEPHLAYQVWLIKPDGGRVSAGLFDAALNSTVTIVPLSTGESLGSFGGLGVTVEPAGGSEAPTGPRVFGVEF